MIQIVSVEGNGIVLRPTIPAAVHLTADLDPCFNIGINHRKPVYGTDIQAFTECLDGARRPGVSFDPDTQQRRITTIASNGAMQGSCLVVGYPIEALVNKNFLAQLQIAASHTSGHR